MTFQAPVPDDTDPRVVDALRYQLTAFAQQIDTSPSLQDVLGRRRRQHRQRVAVAAAGAVAAVAVTVPTFTFHPADSAGRGVPARPTGPSAPATPALSRTLDDPTLAHYLDGGHIVKFVWGGHLRNGHQVILGIAQHADGGEVAFGLERLDATKVVGLGTTPFAGQQVVGLVSHMSVGPQQVEMDKYAILGPPGGTRYEILAPGRTLLGSLRDGGAVLELPPGEKAVAGAPVHVFDRHGTLIAIGVTR